MRALLDVNVLITLIDRNSTARPTALNWLAANLRHGWASCPLTENGCVRVLTNPRYPAPVSPDVVLARMEAIKSNGHHAFWPDDLSITDARAFHRAALRGHQQVTDVYLLALAVAHGGRLVTFDRSIRRETVLGCGPQHLVVL